MLDPERIPKPLHPVDIQNITFEEIDPKEVARQVTHPLSFLHRIESLTLSTLRLALLNKNFTELFVLANA